MPYLNIRNERTKRNWTQEYVGQQIGVSNKTIQAIETGQRKPSYDVLIKLCKLFSVPHEEIEQLFAVADESNPLTK